MSLDALIRKLRIHTRLDNDDVSAIQHLPVQTKHMPADTNIALEGDRPLHCCLLSEGFLVRMKTTPEGKRQILSIHIPGEIPDLQSLHLQVMDHDLKTISACTVGYIPHEALRSVTRSRPMVAEAMWRETLIDSSIFREWIVNVGRRAAEQRLAHLVMEMKMRLAAVGRGDGKFDLPMTQGDFADALGLTPVHVNRVLQSLRMQNLLDIRKGEVFVSDPQKLADLGDFNDIYLHLGRNL